MMVYFRLNYDFGYGDDHAMDHPIIEVTNGSMKVGDIQEAINQLSLILKPEFLNKCEVRFMKK